MLNSLAQKHGIRYNKNVSEKRNNFQKHEYEKGLKI